MKIVFRNEHFVAVDKEPGCLTVPARQESDPRPVLGRELEKELEVTIWPVHRLDAEVSGLVLFALNAESHRQASLEFEARRVKKTYQAFSAPADFEVGRRGTWKAKILRGKKRAYENPKGKLAVTDFEVVGTGSAGEIEWRLFPQTGRSHQLRWELFRHESPILGDSLYGSDRPWSRGIALRSLALAFDSGFAGRWGLPAVLEVVPFPSVLLSESPV